LHYGFESNQFFVFSERFDFEDLACAGFGLQRVFHGWREGVELDLLFDFYDGAVGIDEHVFGVTAHGHFGFEVGLAFFFFLREALDGGSFALGGYGFFDGRRKVGALSLLFLGEGDGAEGEGCKDGKV